MRREKRERQGKILTALSSAPSLRVAELAQKLNVSTETIRRDLDELTQAGVLNRTYGGAVRAMNTEPGSAFQGRSLPAHQKLAKATVEQIADARILLIGSGITAVHVALEIAARLRDIMVVTHSFSVAAALGSNTTIKVMMIPGFYHAGEASTTGGHAIVFLQSLYADYVILGPSGLTKDGPNDALPEIAAINTAMLARASKSILIADQGKFNQLFATRFANWQQVNMLVTDGQPPDELHQSMAQHRVQLILA
ncbi:DeoR/GlpR family DNA-binding transcription regulator [Acidocella aminolytica]|jgi:DeoR/GlpR family transcriptional regulator of sugar metabolism|uniref:Transcriptional regulator DeoR n=1 Tax=Acidocella aminolytica 101 = DSM 11237 TaxID=1120923 RepID=A0A0D6PJF9_9PROT|nr:DeoR/GlpR family DNA-binding transcription regulator [Acidocella aminolytica]GAN81308.1 transcriptional regulator DeoR [Acidocella aminolytica 101 = DSM 11237]GBQ36958.1 MocR family transcriptional regulator [Acidocella aminolytica 101 = DSM 11237]SHE83031.1 transcriptional regulator, DeoR family [Acidocella aminolytica 101 = DSM 11237]